MNFSALTEHPVDSRQLLIVSKEAGILHSLASIGENGRWQVGVASSGWDAMEQMQSGTVPRLLLLDLAPGDSDNLHMLRSFRRLSPDVPVIVICDAADVRAREEAERLRVQTIMTRPPDQDEVQFFLRRYAYGSAALQKVTDSVEQFEPGAFFVSASPLMQKLRAQAELLAQADVPVLIAGENGSGKDAVAQLIHRLSLRSGFRFLKVNCAAPEDLLEEELFGAAVFGGAANGSANGDACERGTLFLDEIAEIPPALQARMMEALKNYDLRTEAAAAGNPARLRILSATSDDMERALAERRLREDLYRRLSPFTLQLPPLRQRKEEIPSLLRYSMRRLARHYGVAAREFAPATLQACQQYGWPGNLTELDSFVKRYLVAGEATPLPRDGDSMRGEKTAGAWNGKRSQEFGGGPGAEATVSGTETVSEPPKSLKSFLQDIKSEAERRAIGAALEKTGWNRKAAARLLRVSYRSLLYKIEQYQMKAGGPLFSSSPLESLAFDSAGKRNGKAS